MTEVQTYDEFMKEIKFMEFSQMYGKNLIDKIRGSDLLTIKTSVKDILVLEEEIKFMKKIESARTLGDNKTKLRLQQKLKERKMKRI
jgi:hypothetical protein